MSDSVNGDEDNGPRNHPVFYFKDGSAIFKVTFIFLSLLSHLTRHNIYQLTSRECPEGVLYKLHPGLLGARSTFFESLFSLPRSPESPEQIISEGKIDGNPIELPSCISQEDWDSLLTYLFLGPSMHPKSLDFLTSVMKLSAFFDIEDGITHATQELQRLGDQLQPALQFELARCFRVDAWIDPAFRRLMKMSLRSLDSYEVAQIGHHGYFWLTQTKAKISALRSKIAFHVPPIVNSGDCDTPATCMVSWTREWEERVRQLLHHPDTPISCLALLDQLRNTHIEGLYNECQDLTVTWIWGKRLLTREEELVDEAIKVLMDLQTDQPLRAALSESIRVFHGWLFCPNSCRNSCLNSRQVGAQVGA
ncbi:hypothetical protein B0H15DRAFT_793764 [Mycena belliarum]|uniref:BTB domain-containing protein n=1 Tax=Mycena belliarum TaxID=1033014 RepID=A0AAD6TR95_9AGAR|nr:hypothetical protein B0H15DRAFT_793764 [Mycena belliae]